MAATSTSWGLGAHKMTADISAPTPVANLSADSPIKAKSFSTVDGGAVKEAKVPSSSMVPLSPKEAPSSPKATPLHAQESASATKVDSSVSHKGSSPSKESLRSWEVPSSTTAAIAPAVTLEHGNGVTTATGAEAAASAATAPAATAAKLSTKSNGVARVAASLDGNAAKDAMKDDCSEAGGTSSDSGGEDDEERGGSSSAPGREEGQAGGVEAVQANGQQHGPVQSTVSAGVSAGNAQGSPRHETDEHAARASDAATAALMAALASATREPPPQLSRPAGAAPKALSPKGSPTVGAAESLRREKVDVACTVAGARALWSGRGRDAGDPIMFFSQLPHTAGESAKGELKTLVNDMKSAGYDWPRSPSPSPSDLSGVGSGTGVEGVDTDVEDGLQELPPPLALPLTPIPCMVGVFKIDEAAGTHRCSGTWAMNKADLIAAETNEARASPFEFKAKVPALSPLSFPHSGVYQGYFLVRQGPRPALKVVENELQINFVKNSGGGWNVEGKGHNIYGTFTITGCLGADRRLEVYRTYAAVPKKSTSARGGHRRSSSISATEETASSQQAPPAHALYGRTPGLGKHPRTESPVASPFAEFTPGTPGASNGVAAGWPSDSAREALLESSAPAAPSLSASGRRISRTPSYLIKDIGSEGTAHLSHGLRKCSTLLKSLMAVHRKSVWFEKPVDHVRLQLADYTRIIKRPMDLGTVRKKLEGGEYENTEEFAAEVRLVFSNARLYNSDPNSAVHVAARELYELFETKFQALGPGLDDPAPKRKKSSSNGGASGSGGASANYGANHSAAVAAPAALPAPPAEAEPYSDRDNFFPELEDDVPSPPPPQPLKDKKRKSWVAGAGSSVGGAGAGGSASKKPRAAAESKMPKVEKGEGGKKSKKQTEKKARAASSPDLTEANAGRQEENKMETQQPTTEESMVVTLQRQIAELQAGLMLLANQQGQGTAVDISSPAEVKKQMGAKGAGRKKSAGAGAKAAGTPKSGGKLKAAAKPKTPKTPKTPKPKAGKGQGRGGAAAQAKAAAARAKAEAEATAAQAAMIPLTFDEKKALSVAINDLDQNNLTRVVEIIQARMPLGSSDEEIELDIDAMDNLTLRDLQRFIVDVTAAGGCRSRNDSGSRRAGASDSESDGEAW